MSSVIDMDLLLAERKSEMAQKKVTVCPRSAVLTLGRNPTYRQRHVKFVILRAEFVQGIDEIEKASVWQGRQKVGAYQLQGSKRGADKLDGAGVEDGPLGCGALVYFGTGVAFDEDGVDDLKRQVPAADEGLATILEEALEAFENDLVDVDIDSMLSDGDLALRRLKGKERVAEGFEETPLDLAPYVLWLWGDGVGFLEENANQSLGRSCSDGGSIRERAQNTDKLIN